MYKQPISLFLPFHFHIFLSKHPCLFLRIHNNIRNAIILVLLWPVEKTLQLFSDCGDSRRSNILLYSISPHQPYSTHFFATSAMGIYIFTTRCPSNSSYLYLLNYVFHTTLSHTDPISIISLIFLRSIP